MQNLYNIKEIYIEKSIFNHKNTKDIISRFPEAKHKFVDSHWNIPSINQREENVDSWNKIKREVLIIGAKKQFLCRENGRSTDFVAPSHSNGCTMACVYCYVARRKGYANPVTVFSNIEDIKSFIKKHVNGLPQKSPNQCDPTYWIYDIGENSDCSADDYLSNNVKTLIDFFKESDRAKGSFATKHVNTKLLDYDPQKKTRIRFSLMPESTSKVVDVRTSPIKDRIAVINDFVAAGYEVHINLSPVIVYEGWIKDYEELFTEINDSLNEQSKAQLKSEIIFLTHNEELHQINNKWHPVGEKLLWRPEWQEKKISNTGGENLRYSINHKPKMISMFKEIYNKHLKYCEIRYVF